MKSLRRYCLIVVGIVGVFFLIAGNGGKNTAKDELSTDIDAWSNYYYNSNAYVAKKETLKLVQKLKYFKNKGGEGYNFNLMLGLSYARLYLIEMAAKSPEKAKLYIDKFLSLDNENKKLNQAEKEREKEKIINFVRKMDCNRNGKLEWLNCGKLVQSSHIDNTVYPDGSLDVYAFKL